MDQVTWSPRVGSTGDDKYNVPGAINIAGSRDTSNPERVNAYSGSFSSTPTIAEINAANGVNQVVGLLKRRALQANALLGTSLTYPAFAEADKKIRTAASGLGEFEWPLLKAAIDALRAAEGFATYSWPTAPTGSPGQAAYYLSHARKALALSGLCSMQYGQRVFADSANYAGYTNPKTWSAFASGGVVYPTSVGEKDDTSTSRYTFTRIVVFPWIFNWDGLVSGDIVSAYIQYTVSATAGSPGNVNCYAIPTGTYGDTGTLEGSNAGTSGTLTIAVDKTRVTSNLGAQIQYTLAASKEVAGGVAPSSGNSNSFNIPTAGTVANRPFLVIDFG